jgi:hypothetical protein
VFTVAPPEAPEWASDPEQLANAMEARENRKDSQVGFEWTLALPAAVSPEARRKIAQEFAQEVSDTHGMAGIVALHAPDEEGDERNYHAHFLFTTRRVEAEGLTQKVTAFSTQPGKPNAEVTRLREYAAKLINDALEDAGSAERVDHRSFAERGIAGVPSQHLGPIAMEIERDGRRSIKGDINRDIEARNEEIAASGQEIDRLVAELATLEAGIVDAEEQELDRRFGPEETQRPRGAEWAERGPGEEPIRRTAWGTTSAAEMAERTRAYEQLMKEAEHAEQERPAAPPVPHASPHEPDERHARDSWAGRHAPEPRRDSPRPSAGAAEAEEPGKPPQTVPEPSRPANALDAAWERASAEQQTQPETPAPDEAEPGHDQDRDKDEPDMD